MASPRVCCWAVTRPSGAAMPLAASEPIGLAPRPRGASRLARTDCGSPRLRAPPTYADHGRGLAGHRGDPRVPARRAPRRVRGRALRRHGVGARSDRAAADRRAARAQRGVASDHRGGRRDGRPPRSLSRVEHGGPGRPAQRAGGGRRSDRRAAPLVPGRQSAGADADRRGVSDPRRRGGAGRADVVHAGRAARPAVVAAAHLPCGDRGGQRRPAAARPLGRAASCGGGSP